MVVNETFVFALSLLMMEMDPSVLWVRLIIRLKSLRVSLSMAENMMLKSMGAKTHPCFTSFMFVTGNASYVYPLSRALSTMLT